MTLSPGVIETAGRRRRWSSSRCDEPGPCRAGTLGLVDRGEGVAPLHAARRIAARPAPPGWARQFRSRSALLQALPVAAWLCVLGVLLGAASVQADSPQLFRDGNTAYQDADYPKAARLLRESVAERPSAGALQNLGNAEWQRGRVGAAVLAWEQALWLDPGLASARNNLRFARETAQLEAPELNWYETASAWLAVNTWPWITALSLWLVIAMLTLPAVFRWRKAGWQQAVAALSLGVFLLCLPAHFGAHSRPRLGFILERDVPLRLTPTREAEEVTRLAAGEPGRLVRERRDFVFIQTSRAAGWVERGEFGMISPR